MTKRSEPNCYKVLSCFVAKRSRKLGKEQLVDQISTNAVLFVKPKRRFGLTKSTAFVEIWCDITVVYIPTDHTMVKVVTPVKITSPSQLHQSLEHNEVVLLRKPRSMYKEPSTFHEIRVRTVSYVLTCSPRKVFLCLWFLRYLLCSASSTKYYTIHCVVCKVIRIIASRVPKNLWHLA